MEVQYALGTMEWLISKGGIGAVDDSLCMDVDLFVSS